MDVVKTYQEKNNSANEAVYKEATTLFNQKASQGIESLQKVSLHSEGRLSDCLLVWGSKECGVGYCLVLRKLHN